ncbi:MAG: MFS transporter [Bacillaceae bacterium]|nr:MFS transporter [Bacillaceae bacterium]
MTKFRDYHRNVKIRIVQIFLSDTVAGAIFPFLAIYFSDHFGATLTGILLIINVILAMFVGLYGGYYADLIGRKRLMVIAGIMRMGAFFVIAAVNSPWFTSPEITYIMTVLIWSSFGLDGPAAEAMLIDITKPKERKGVFSLIYWSFNLAFAVGGIVGALMFTNHLFLLLLGLSVSMLISNILVIFFIEETLENPATERQTKVIRKMMKSYREVAGDRVFMMFVLAGLFIQSLELHLENYIAVRLHNEMPEQSVFGFSVSGVEMVGFLKSENTILVVLLTVFITGMVSKMKDGQTMLISILIYSVGYAVVSYFNNIWILFIFMAVATIGELMRVPVQQEYLASIPPDDKRSSYLAVNGLLFYGASIISSLFVSLGAVLSTEIMGILIFGSGLMGLVIMKGILPQLEERKIKMAS